MGAIYLPAASSVASELESKIATRIVKSTVLGLGYVGLPLAIELARSGLSVVGVDPDRARVEKLNRGERYIDDVDQHSLASLLQSRTLHATVDYRAIGSSDTISICVPTPLRKTKDPDLSHILAAAKSLVPHLHPGMLVILESTAYPGTTEEIVLPILEHSGLKVGKEFFLCYSPERIDPGNKQFYTRNIPKVIGGVTPVCTRMGNLFYSNVIEQVVPVSSVRVAEMVKLLENTFRMINIGLANEMAQMCDRMQVDVWEVIDAASTKPFGFMPFYPGPGLGGHCIPVDPFYLSWKSKQSGHDARFIELAGQINAQMPRFVVEKVQTALNERMKPVKGSKIHIVGVAYKPNVSDVRESPALDIIRLLQARGAKVSFSDPFVQRLQIDARNLDSRPAEEAARSADCVVVVTNHASVDHARLAALASLIVDTRNVLKNHKGTNIVRL